MKRFCSGIKKISVIFLGFLWGAMSFFWLFYSILFLGNFMEEPGSYEYAEGESMRIYGLIGCIIYFIVFAGILFYIPKRKRCLFMFLLSMILGVMVSGAYIFVFKSL